MYPENTGRIAGSPTRWSPWGLEPAPLLPLPGHHAMARSPIRATISNNSGATSVDGGKTWVAAPATVQAKTQILGLTPGATVQFRYRTVTPKAGQGDWNQPVQLLIS
jgi:hypothetical protein